MTMTAMDPPGAYDRRWRCRDCGEEGTLDVLRAQSCAKARVGDLSPEQQLAAWVDGRSICPNTDGECCPDFSCCTPKLLWPPEKRAAFAKAEQGTREKMMAGSVDGLLESVGEKVRVTRGEPGDHG
jgi:hypothetical protein